MSQTKVEAPFVENNQPFRNFCINGDMKFNQRAISSTTGLGAGGAHYLVDRTRTYSVTTAGRYTISQETDVPSGLGFTNSLKIQCTTADTSIAAGELTLIQHRMEGQFLQSIAKGTSSAKQLTVSFYAKANEARVHSLEVKDEDNTRHCSKLFATTTDWKRHVLTFPADTTGALDNDNAQSISLNFFMHAGSTYTDGTLQSGSFAAITNGNRAAGIGSIMASTDNNFFITGLQMELGDAATDFEFVPHDVQLQRCQRYYEKSYNLSVTPGTSTTYEGTTLAEVIADGTTTRIKMFDSKFLVRKRAAPTLTIYTSDGGASGEINNYSSGADKTISSIGNTSETNLGRYMTMTDAGATNETYEFQYQADAEIG